MHLGRSLRTIELDDQPLAYPVESEPEPSEQPVIAEPEPEPEREAVPA